MMDDALLAGERAKAKKPDNWEITGTPQSKEAYGCMLRKDDAPFKQLMDDTIAKAQTSGEATKWFDTVQTANSAEEPEPELRAVF